MFKICETVMRLWSIHPMYLDTAGLTACWREGLLARKVLSGETKGYKNHPQLLRFKQFSEPVKAIDAYLHAIFDEALARGYNYDPTKITRAELTEKIPVTQGQLQYEFEHLKRKLLARNMLFYNKLLLETSIEANPLFEITEGGIEDWEVTK